ncbi:MAG: MarR family transcriptional regulator [Gemmatimonadales bacterium]
MTGHLQKELKQEKPFTSLQQEVVLNVMRTAGALRQGTSALLRGHDISPPQYNILRILRGAGEKGLPSSEVGERLVTRDPDVTRLLDRLEKRGFASRDRSSSDRRVVTARITKKGIELVNRLDSPVYDLHVSQLAHMKKKEMRALIDLLEKARGESE